MKGDANTYSCVTRLVMIPSKGSVEVKKSSEKGGMEDASSRKLCAPQLVHRGDLVEIPSPDNNWSLSILIKSVDWKNETFEIQTTINDKSERGKDTEEKVAIVKFNKKVTYVSLSEDQKVTAEFTLTWYDFPFTDFTLLADGSRFALVLEKVKPKDERADFSLVWFPKDYFSPRERPVNYQQFRDKLFLDIPQ